MKNFKYIVTLIAAIFVTISVTNAQTETDSIPQSVNDSLTKANIEAARKYFDSEEIQVTGAKNGSRFGTVNVDVLYKKGLARGIYRRSTGFQAGVGGGMAISNKGHFTPMLTAMVGIELENLRFEYEFSYLPKRYIPANSVGSVSGFGDKKFASDAHVFKAYLDLFKFRPDTTKGKNDFAVTTVNKAERFVYPYIGATLGVEYFDNTKDAESYHRSYTPRFGVAAGVNIRLPLGLPNVFDVTMRYPINLRIEYNYNLNGRMSDTDYKFSDGMHAIQASLVIRGL